MVKADSSPIAPSQTEDIADSDKSSEKQKEVALDGLLYTLNEEGTYEVGLERGVSSSSDPVSFSVREKIFDTPVTAIADDGFAECIRPNNDIQLPKTIGKIGKNAFYHCMDLKRINFRKA